MKNNTLAIALALGALALVSVCCVTGLGVFGFVRYREHAQSVQYEVTPPPAPPALPLAPPSGPQIAPTSGAVMGGAPATLAVLPTSPVMGPETAPVTIHIVSDFQCPFCGRVTPTVHELMQTYEGRVRFVWHDYPLPFHPNAVPAAEAGQEVMRQLGSTAFWRFHNALFENQNDLSRAAIEQMAGQIPGLDLARFRSALDTHEHEPTIRSDMALADAAHPGGLGTPSFLIDGAWLEGAQPSASFHAAIDAALAGR